MPRPRVRPKQFTALPPTLAQWPGYVMKFVFEAWFASYEQEVAELGVSVNALLVLVVLDQEGPDSPSRLAKRVGMDRSVMVAVVDELEDRGLLERRRGESDRRTIALHVTEVGHELAARGLKMTEASNMRMLSVLSPAECATFAHLLSRLPEALEYVASPQP